MFEYQETLNSKLIYIDELITYYFSILIIPPGIIFNFIAFYMFRKRQLNKTYMGFLFSILSAWQNAVLFYCLFVSNSHIVFKYNLRMCGILTHVKQDIYNISSWIHVAISFERLLCVHLPKKIPTKKFITLILFIFVILVFGLNTIFFFFKSNHDKNNSLNETNLTSSEKCTASSVIILSTDLIVLLMQIYIPFGFILVFNLLIVKKLIKKHFRLTFLKKECRYTVFVFQIDTVFWIFYAPISACVVINLVSSFTNIFKKSFDFEIYSLVFKISQLIALSYHSWFFFIVLALNRKFRNEFLITIRLKKRSMRRRKKIIRHRLDKQRALKIVKRRFVF